MYQVPRRPVEASLIIAADDATPGRAAIGMARTGAADRDESAMPSGPAMAHRDEMAHEPVLAEYLPTLYRLALDAVDQLARSGRRAEAGRLRRDASRAYSRAWDESCRRTLEDVIRRAHASAGTAAPVPPGLTAPSAG